MRKAQLMNDILIKHGGKTVREDGRNYWIKGDEKILVTSGFLFKKSKEPVVVPQIEEKVIPVVTEPVIVVEKPKPIVKKKIVVEKPKEPDVES